MNCTSYLAAPSASPARPRRGLHLSPWAVAPVALLILAAPSRAATSVFNDNFNRDDAGSLGPNWSPASAGQLDTNGLQAHWISGSNTMYYLSGLTGAYTHTTLKVDVSNLGSTGFQSVALLIGQPNSPSSAGLFLQIVAENVTGNFNRIELDTGVNQSDPSKWTTPTSIFTPTPFASARVTASAVDVDTIRIGIDCNSDGTDDQAFTRDLNLSAMGFGSRMGLSINGGAMRADNFSPASLLRRTSPGTSRATGRGIARATTGRAARCMPTDSSTLTTPSSVTPPAGQSRSPAARMRRRSRPARSPSAPPAEPTLSPAPGSRAAR